MPRRSRRRGIQSDWTKKNGSPMDNDIPGMPQSALPDVETVHDEILAVLEIVPPHVWSFGEASLVLSTLSSFVVARECSGNVVSLAGRRSRRQGRAR